jgi:hypothetical protein
LKEYAIDMIDIERRKKVGKDMNILEIPGENTAHQYYPHQRWCYNNRAYWTWGATDCMKLGQTAGWKANGCKKLSRKRPRVWYSVVCRKV